MKRSADQFDRLILHAVCEDLAPFEAIVNNIREHLETEDLEQVASRLLGLIMSGMVDSYLLHIEPPYLTPVDTDAEGIYRHWFFISEAGLNHLIQLGSQSGTSGEWTPPSERGHRSRLRSMPRHGKRMGC